MDVENGEEVYVGDRFVGIWIGNNPITGSEVVYKEDGNEYRAFHTYQILKYPCVTVSAKFNKAKGE